MPELMAAYPVLPLQPSYQIRFEAIDPNSGATVSGVTVSQAVIYASEAGVGETPEQVGPFMLVPGPESVAA